MKTELGCDQQILTIMSVRKSKDTLVFSPSFTAIETNM